MEHNNAILGAAQLLGALLGLAFGILQFFFGFHPFYFRTDL